MEVLAPQGSETALEDGYAARAALQGLCCRGYAAGAMLPGLCVTDHDARAALQGLCCRDCAALKVVGAQRGSVLN